MISGRATSNATTDNDSFCTFGYGFIHFFLFFFSNNIIAIPNNIIAPPRKTSVEGYSPSKKMAVDNHVNGRRSMRGITL